MGHALNGSMQDVIIRLRRMQGRKALWICGTDHAGIATQNVVERMLGRMNLTREELGREEFVRRVWNWREESGATIIDQFKQLGCSLDYEHERFTMDPEYARAVVDVFVELHRRGYLYRANRMINWCTVCATAISDLEVEHLEVDDTLYFVDYPLVEGGHVTVATVRPVTLLGDTAVAVNPSDERYSHLIGSAPIVPLVEREVPIVGDEHVDPDRRHRRAQGDAGPRPERPRDRPPPRPRGDRRDRLRRPHDGGGRRALRGPDRGGGAQARRRRPARARPAARGAAVAAQRRALLALGQPRGAARLAAVVLRHAGARRAGDRRRARGARALRSQEPRAHLLRLDGADQAVVRLAPALVGPPAAGLVLQLRRDDRAGRAADALPGLRLRRAASATRTCSTPGSPRRSGRSRRSAGRRRRRGTARSTRARAVHGARHHQPLGRAHGDDGHRVHRDASRSSDVVIHPTVLATRRPADVEVARHRRRSARPDRRGTAPTPRATACSR